MQVQFAAEPVAESLFAQVREYDVVTLAQLALIHGEEWKNSCLQSLQKHPRVVLGAMHKIDQVIPQFTEHVFTTFFGSSLTQNEAHVLSQQLEQEKPLLLDIEYEFVAALAHKEGHARNYQSWFMFQEHKDKLGNTVSDL